MTRPCRWCPFTACDSCPWKGGETAGQPRSGGVTEGLNRTRMEDVSDPRDAPTSGGPAEQHLEEMFDMGSIPTFDAQRHDEVARFWAKVSKGSPGDCWRYNGSLSDNGYGTAQWEGRTVAAHRLSYLLAHGELPPEGWHTDHLCRVRHCVNPAHLEAVPPSVNFTRGSHPNAILHRTNVCKHGHAFTPENTYWRPNGTRNCITCLRRTQNEGRARRKRERGYR